MSGLNKVLLIGRLGQDPELKHTPSGAAVCNFSLATSETWNDKSSGQKQERTEWHRVVLWGKIAELANQFLKKGSQCYVEGSLQTRSWDDKDGNKKYTTEINGKSVQFLDAKFGGDDNQKPAEQKEYDVKRYDVTVDAEFTADDVPF